MHSIELKNPYDKPIHFNQLARAIPAFKPYLISTARGGHTIDWRNDSAIRALTNALLERDFGLKVDLPEDRLCPIIPGRLEYVLWILEVALSTLPNITSHSPDVDPITLRGIDIGTGSSVIYPLLAMRTLPPPHVLRFTATEIDKLSFVYAERNIQNNQLGQSIVLVRAEEDGAIFGGCTGEFDMTMCNPPFYASYDEVKELQSQKASDPFSVCTGASNEMITTGGEVEFVGRMVVESLEIGSRIRWFSSLLGKLSSVIKIVELLHSHSIDNYGIKETTQGKTKRWIIAWSLGYDRLADSLARPTTASLSKLVPLSNSHFSYCLPSPTTTPTTVRDIVSSILESLEITQHWISSPFPAADGLSTVDVETAELLVWRNTWSREFRRKKGRGEIADAITGANDERRSEDAMLGLRIVIRWVAKSVDEKREEEFAGVELTEEGAERQVVVELRWTRGKGENRVGFNSLFAHLARRVSDSLLPHPPSSDAMDLT